MTRKTPASGSSTAGRHSKGRISGRSFVRATRRSTCLMTPCHLTADVIVELQVACSAVSAGGVWHVRSHDRRLAGRGGRFVPPALFDKTPRAEPRRPLHADV